MTTIVRAHVAHTPRNFPQLRPNRALVLGLMEWLESAALPAEARLVDQPCGDEQ
jgi:hypothetical protein